MTEIMASIKPEWCALIASGEKTVEVRKSAPKETPFKVYIYCTSAKYNGKYLHTSNIKRLYFWKNPEDCIITVQPENYIYKAYTCRGKVIGEFVCDSIIECPKQVNQPFWLACRTQITDKAYVSYLGNKDGCGWNISNLKIYDKPLSIDDFYVTDNASVQSCRFRMKKKILEHQSDELMYGKIGYWCCKNNSNCDKCWTIPLQRPPQSWCYVRSKSNE